MAGGILTAGLLGGALVAALARRRQGDVAKAGLRSSEGHRLMLRYLVSVPAFHFYFQSAAAPDPSTRTRLPSALLVSTRPLAT
jgi:hypothetical protein